MHSLRLLTFASLVLFVARALAEGAETPRADAKLLTADLATCVASWDSGSHITKSHWRKVCQRSVNYRSHGH
jgi:hypothetical protein